MNPLHGKSRIIATLLIGLGLASMAYADDNAGLMGNDGLSIQVGPGYLTPDMAVKVGHDDNLLRSSSNELSTFYSIFQPHANYEIKTNDKRAYLDYLMDAGVYDNSSNDNYIDNRIQTGFDYSPSDRILAGVQGEFFDSHDPRGTGRDESVTGPLQPDPDEWHHFNVEGNFVYGAQTTPGRIELGLGHTTKRYDNNRAFTLVRDRDDNYGDASFYYRIRPATEIVMETRVTDFSYAHDAVGVPSLDSTDYQYLLGVTWEATFKTTGFAKFGYIQKDFNSSLRNDGSGGKWEVGVQWRPRSYSTVDLATSRNYNETNGTGNFITEDTVTASWTHAWLTRLSTYVDITYTQDSFAASSRNDDLFNTGFGVKYQMRPWMSLTSGYRYDERDSNVNAFDYSRNIFEIVTADFTL